MYRFTRHCDRCRAFSFVSEDYNCCFLIAWLRFANTVNGLFLILTNLLLMVSIMRFSYTSFQSLSTIIIFSCRSLIIYLLIYSFLPFRRMHRCGKSTKGLHNYLSVTLYCSIFLCIFFRKVSILFSHFARLYYVRNPVGRSGASCHSNSKVLLKSIFQRLESGLICDHKEHKRCMYVCGVTSLAIYAHLSSECAVLDPCDRTKTAQYHFI